jgi:hypothetical protein
VTDTDKRNILEDDKIAYNHKTFCNTGSGDDTLSEKHRIRAQHQSCNLNWVRGRVVGVMKIILPLDILLWHQKVPS